MPSGPRVARWAAWTGAGWLGLLCLPGTACVAVLLGAPGLLLQVASALAAGGTVAFGIQIGRRRGWWYLLIAALAGAAVLVCSAEAAWAATFFEPTAGGSGGFLEILAPVLIAVLAGTLALAALAALLGAGVLLGLATHGHPRLRGLASLGAVLAVVGIAAGAGAATKGAGNYGVDVTATRGNVTGVWKSSRGAMLRLARDGTFTASGLPAGIGDWAVGVTPASGPGTWQVGQLEPGTPPGVIFDFADGSQAELQLETDGSSLAMYYDLGDPDEGWSGQYRLVKQ